MKIKRIEIQAFKSYLYKKDGTFDFMIDDQTPANFISIYAPNGFGKTAFYDAVDYCITNNISRYIRSDRGKRLNENLGKSNNKKGEKQYILRNRDISEEDAPLETMINIDATIAPFQFQSDYNQPRNRGMDYQFNLDDTPKNRKFFREVMLTQEAIDAFLREDSPAERYKKFIDQQQFNDLASIDDNRQSINRMLAVIKGKEKELSDNKTKIAESLTQINVQKDVFIEANKLVDKLCLLGFDLLNIENPYSQLQKQQLDDRIKLITSEINEKDKTQQLEIQLITIFSSNIGAYESQHKAKTAIDSELISLFKIVDDKQQTDLKKQQKQSHHNQLNLLSEKQKELNEYLKQLPQLINLQQKLVEIKKRISEQKTALSAYNSSIELNTNKLKVSNESLQQFIVEKDKLTELQTASKSYYLKISEYQKEITDNTKLIEEERVKQLTIRQVIERIKTERKQVQSFSVAQLISNEIGLSDKDTLNTLHRKFKAEEAELAKLFSIKKSAQAELSNIQQQSSAINELIRQGSAIISQTEQANCPLCLQSYQDLRALQDKILNNPALGNAEKKILDEINQITSRVIASKVLLEQFKLSYENQIKVMSDLLEKDYSSQRLLLQKSISFEEKFKLDSVLVGEELGLLLEKTRFKDADKLKGYLGIELTSLAQKINQSQSDIKEYEDKLKKENDDKNAQSQSLNLLLVEQKQLSNNKELSSLQKFLATKFIDEVTQFEVLKEKLIVFQSKNQIVQDNQRESIKTLFSEIDALEKSIPIEYQQQSILEIKAIQSSKQKKLNELLKYIATHEKAVTSLDIDDLIESGNWSSVKDKVNSTLRTLEIGIKANKQNIIDIQLLSEFALDALSFCNKAELVEQKGNIEAQMVKLDSIKKELGDDLKKISLHLTKAIDKYFYTGLINQLYAAIDPHPEFKEIQFNCKIPETGDKAELNIQIRNPKDDSVVSPTLHFSSAQINVLSLSIFLARALNVKDDNGNAVDCIFIDDPVQSMDSINVLGLIDLLRNLSTKFDKQFIISTHDENFHELLKKKIPAGSFNAKYFELESFGKVVEQ